MHAFPAHIRALLAAILLVSCSVGEAAAQHAARTFPSIEPAAFVAAGDSAYTSEADAAEQAGAALGAARFLQWPARDAGALARGVVSRKALYVAGAGVGLYLLSRYDEPVTYNAREMERRDWAFAASAYFSKDYLRPIALGLFGASLLTDNARFQDAAFTSLQAMLYSSLITGSLKGLVGRHRPHENDGAFVFEPLSGHTSFPSGHSTLAFAAVTPWLMYYPGLVTPGLLVVAGATAISRLVVNRHWMTDVIAGSAIGFGTGYWLSMRHQQAQRRVQVTPQLSTNAMGFTLTMHL